MISQQIYGTCYMGRIKEMWNTNILKCFSLHHVAHDVSQKEKWTSGLVFIMQIIMLALKNNAILVSLV